MTEHKNPPAFPTKQPLTSDFLGLTMLDHFAGLAMQIMFAETIEPKDVAKDAYEMADAMLKERVKWIK